MITRIVKMTFRETKVEDFKKFAATIQPRIRNFPGCEFLDILQDISNPNIFFTVSRWKSEEDLKNYRNSDFFRATWTKTRAWFSAGAEAWSAAPVPTGKMAS